MLKVDDYTVYSFSQIQTKGSFLRKPVVLEQDASLALQGLLWPLAQRVKSSIALGVVPKVVLTGLEQELEV